MSDHWQNPHWFRQRRWFWRCISCLLMHLLTIFCCPDGDFCVVVTLYDGHWDYSDVVSVVWMERWDDGFSGICLNHFPPLASSLQLCDIESVLPDEAIMCVLWRVVPVDMDGGRIKLNSSNVCRASNRSCIMNVVEILFKTSQLAFVSSGESL